jgi:acyl dehydratase
MTETTPVASEPRTVEREYGGTHDLFGARKGDDLGSLEFVVTDEMVRRNAWANDDYNPWYLVESPFGGRIASPVIVASFDARLFYGHFAYPEGGSLFAKQEFEYVRPLFVGEPYTLSGRVADIYERRGRTFFRIGMSITDANGVECMRMTKTIAAPVTPIGSDTNDGGQDT